MSAVNYIEPRRTPPGLRNNEATLFRCAGPGYVYRFLDVQGRLLYVGCTGNMQRRLIQHRGASVFWPLVDAVEVQPYERYGEAFAAEEAQLLKRPGMFNGGAVGVRRPERQEAVA